MISQSEKTRYFNSNFRPSFQGHYHFIWLTFLVKGIANHKINI